MDADDASVGGNLGRAVLAEPSMGRAILVGFFRARVNPEQGTDRRAVEHVKILGRGVLIEPLIVIIIDIIKFDLIWFDCYHRLIFIPILMC